MRGAIRTTTEVFGWKATAGPCSSNEIIEELQNALKEEIYEKEHGTSESRIELVNGERVFSDTFKTVYRFLLSQDLVIEDDMPVDILIGNEKTSGSVVSTDENSISIAFEQSYGDYIQKASLIKSDGKLLKELIAKFDFVKSGKISFNHEGCLQLFGLKKSDKRSDLRSLEDLSIYTPPPNIHQVNAIESAFNQQITFIWGPPGTGKTKTLGIILDQLLKQKIPVLLVSHTNLAVDEILLKYASIKSSRKFIEDGKIIRVGTPGKDDPLLNQLTLDSITKRLSAEPLDRLTKSTSEKQKLETNLKKFKDSLILQRVQRYEQIQTDIHSLPNKISQYEKEISEAKEKEDYNIDQLRLLKNRLC